MNDKLRIQLEGKATYETNFLHDIFESQLNYKNALDNKANILLGVSGLIFGLGLTQINVFPSQLAQLGMYVLIAATAITSLLCIWTIKLPFKRQVFKQSSMCFYGFENLKYNQYLKKVKKVLTNRDDIVDEYVTEIYGIYKNSIEPKYALVRYSAILLTVGFILGGILVIAGSV